MTPPVAATTAATDIATTVAAADPTRTPTLPPSSNHLAPWRATGALLLLLALAVTLLLGPQHALRRLSVDALDLLPRDEQDPTIRLARQTAGGRFGRTMLFALSDAKNPGQPPTAAAARFAQLLAADPSVAGAFAGLDDAGRDRLGQWFFERRLPLRFPVWLEELSARWQRENPGQGDNPTAAAQPPSDWLAARAAERLNDFLLAPEADAARDLLPRDPLLLIPALLETFGGDEKSTKGVSGGALTGEGADGVRYALVYAETRYSPLDDAGQRPVFAAIERAFAGVQGGQAVAAGASNGQGQGQELKLRWSGVNKFAAETRHKAEAEMAVLSNISLIATALLMLWAFRSVAVFAYLVLPILTATAWSMVVCFAVFPRVHVVTLIFTSVLVGVALDYGIYALTHAQRVRGGLREALRDLRRPLVAGCLTSVGGFVFLILTKLPMLQQMGLAVALGLIFALTLDFLYLPWVPALGVRRDTSVAARPLERRLRLDLSGKLYPALLLALPLVLAGWVWASRPHWNDDIRALQSIDPAMQAEEHALRGLFGRSTDEHLVLTAGADLDEAFARTAGFNAALAGLQTGGGRGPGEGFFNLARLFPDRERSARAAAWLREHPEFTDTLRRALDADFQEDAFSPFWEAWSAYLKNTLDAPPPGPTQLLAGLRDVLPLPLQNLWSDETPGQMWLVTRVGDSLYQRLPPALLAPPNLPVDQVETLNGALLRYRVTALQYGGIGLGLITVVVLAYYGWRRGGFMLLVPLSSMFFALGTFGFMGQPLSLLHVIAHLLGFCLASDYAIFLASPGDLPHSTRRAVRLAGLVTLISFSVLSFSKMEALHDICLTVALVIAFDLMLCELSHRLFVRPATAADQT